MILLTGGAYQGKKAFAAKRWGVEEDTFFYCSEESGNVDFSKTVVCGLHLLILWQVKNGVDSICWAKEHIFDLRRKIILCDDISCGIVPVEAEMRTWREATGRTLLLLSGQADEVYRLFCGIASRIK